MIGPMDFLLVHSPAVGPSSWRWVAEELRAAGHDAHVPDLTQQAVAGDPLALARAAAATVIDGQAITLVGHSGSGALLPVIAEMLGEAPVRTLFVDAGIPPEAGTATLGGDFLDVLRDLAVAGILPPWSEWFGDGVMAALVPDPIRRGTVAAELPRVPLALYETSFELPAGWRNAPAAYVLLSESYRPDADQASSLGWPVAEHRVGHLGIVHDADVIAHSLIDLGG